MDKFTIENMNLYYGKFHALKDVNIRMKKNRITAFIGPSGCGKSTLLKSLNRMNDLVEGCKITGDIRLDNENIYGDMDVKIDRISQKYEMDRDKAKDLINKKDKQRQSYYNYYTSKKWSQANSYDLCVNSSILGVDGTVNLILQFIEDFENRDVK